MLNNTILYERIRIVSVFADDEYYWFASFKDDLKTEILNLIRKDQLTDKGVDEANEVIGFYSYWTEILSNGTKKEGDPYTLDDTGSFYRSMFVTVFSDSFVIDADSQTFFEMQKQEWWSESILGLTDENLQKVIEQVKEKYRFQMERLLLHGLI